MKVIIMAAGRGTRISRHINKMAKCTLEIKGQKTLIEYIIEAFQNKGIRDIVLVVGYQGASLESLTAKYGIKIHYNNFFDITNSIASLWFARQELEGQDEVILMNGDVFFEERFIDTLVAERLSPVFYADERRVKEADYRFCYRNGLLVKHGKDLKSEETTGEYVGVAKISGPDVAKVRARLDEMIGAQKHSLWWEDTIYDYCAEEEVYVRNVRDLFWAEIDYIEDYQRIQDFLCDRDI